MQILTSNIESGEVIPNIATLLERNVKLFGGKIVYQQKHQGKYEGITWNELYSNILNIAFNLQHRYGFRHGDKMVIFSQNRLEMLELELAVMASGGISVPIFAFFYKETAELLINHSDAKYLAVAGELQLCRVGDINVKSIFVFDSTVKNYFRNQHPFD